MTKQGREQSNRNGPGNENLRIREPFKIIEGPFGTRNG